MAKKLKQLVVDEVSLVDAGANQHAHVTLWKRKDGGAEGGEPAQPAEKPQSALRKFFSFFGRAASMTDADIDEAVASIEKADTFDEKLQERKLCRVMDEIWDMCYALESSLSSIIRDDDVTDKTGMLNQSIDEFTTAIKTMTASWGAGNTVELNKDADIPEEHLKETVKRLEDAISKKAGCKTTKEDGDPEENPEDDEADETGGGAPAGETGKNCNTKKSKEGGIPDMKFDVSKMTSAELAVFEELKKRYGIEEDGDAAPEGAENVGKAADAEETAPQAPAAQETTPAEEAGEDIYKGLHPAVREEIESLKKRLADADHKEMLSVAKKYEIIGKKPEELAKTLEGLKAVGGTAYDDMISTLDAAVDMVSNSGVFGEIGKRGVNPVSGADTIAKVNTFAKELMKAEPELSHAEAVDKAWALHPELVDEYENSRR